MASNRKYEGSLFSSTFKNEEKKVPLFFGVLASGRRYGHLVIFFVFRRQHCLNLEHLSWLLQKQNDTSCNFPDILIFICFRKNYDIVN